MQGVQCTRAQRCGGPKICPTLFFGGRGGPFGILARGPTATLLRHWVKIKNGTTVYSSRCTINPAASASDTVKWATISSWWQQNDNPITDGIDSINSPIKESRRFDLSISRSIISHNTWQRVRRQTYGYLPNSMAMLLSLGRYSLPVPQRTGGWVGVSGWLYMYEHISVLTNSTFSDCLDRKVISRIFSPGFIFPSSEETKPDTNTKNG